MGTSFLERRRLILGMGLKVREIFSDLENPHNLDVWRHLPLKDYPYFSELGTGWNDMLDATPNSAVTKHYDASDTSVPTYYVAAWHDVFAPLQLTAFADAEKKNRNQRLLVLNGTHFTPENPGAWPIAPMLPWFDYHLKGEKSALLDLPRVIFPVANGNDEWYGTDTWPTPAASSTKWYLSADGNMSLQAEEGQAGIRAYKYDPDNPVPTVGGRNLMISHGPLDQNKVRQANRDDVLSYDSAPLTDDLVIAGPVQGNLSISSDAPDTDFTVKILDVAPDGTATLVTEGVLRARYREGLDREVFMKSGEIYQLKVDLGHIAWRFKPGHRVSVDISSSNFPQRDRNLNTSKSLYSGVQRNIANNSVHHGGLNGSNIKLPVISNWDALEKLSDFKTTNGR